MRLSAEGQSSPDELTNFDHRVLAFIRQHDLIPAGETLVVAVSGGPDSVCLLHVLFKLRNELGVKLHIAHMNHLLRGEESENDAWYVADLAVELRLPATIGERDVKQYRKEHHLSLEEAAREVRYTFLAEVANTAGASRIATGHTRDDHIETVLMHLVRGAGTRGMRGLQPVTTLKFREHRLNIVRPLLEVSRAETVSYCEANRLSPRLDVTNLSLSPLRNKIRLRLLPLLRSYNPQIDEVMVRTACLAKDDLAFLEEQVEQVWDKIVKLEQDTAILSKKPLLGLPVALKRHLLRLVIERLTGNLMDIEARHIEQLVEALQKPAGKIINLPSGLIFVIEYDRYLLGTDPAKLVPLPSLQGEYILNIPGETIIPGWKICAEVTGRQEIETDDGFTAYLDFEKSGERLIVRGTKPGDRFQPLGMEQTKKVGQFMIDARIPQTWRKRIPVVASPEQVVWLAGYRIDDRVKVTPESKQILRIEFLRT